MLECAVECGASKITHAWQQRKRQKPFHHQTVCCTAEMMFPWKPWHFVWMVPMSSHKIYNINAQFLPLKARYVIMNKISQISFGIKIYSFSIKTRIENQSYIYKNHVINVNQMVKYTLSRMCDPTETNLGKVYLMWQGGWMKISKLEAWKFSSPPYYRFNFLGLTSPVGFELSIQIFGAPPPS